MAKPKVKELVVNHFEKGIFAIACLLALVTLVGTRWIPYAHHPREITKKVEQASAKIEVKIWPAEEREQFVVPPAESVEALVSNNIRQQVDATPYEFDVPFHTDLYGTTRPITEPDYLGVQALIAQSGRFLMAVKPEPTLPADSEDPALVADAATTPEDDQSAIPAEFRNRDTLRTATGAAGVPGVSGAAGVGGLGLSGGYGADYNPGYGQMEAMSGMMAGYGAGYGESDYGGAMYGEGMYGEGMYGSGMGSNVEGRGLRYVAVRGIIPLREQILKFMKSLNARSFAQASSQYEIIDFELERKKQQPGDDPWGGDWETVNVDVALDILNEALSFDPEVVQGSITDSAVTMPLPGRLMGVWDKKATHPQLENFTLTPEEMEKELAFNRMLLQQYEEQQKNAPEEKVEKKGFASVAYDKRSMAMDTFNMDYEGAMTEEYAYEDYGGYGGMMGGMGMNINYAPTSTGTMTPEAKAFLDKFKKEIGNSKEDRDKALLDYIQERVTAQGELLLFRYFDFDVEPGATYKYRARIEVKNPAYGLPIAQVGGLAHVVEGQTRKSDWSNETEPATVPSDVDYFVAKIDDNGSGLAKTRMAVFQWNPDYGTTVQDSLEVTYGDEIGGPKDTLVLDPAKNRFESEPYKFHTGDVLVDALPGEKISSSEHPDLRLPRSAHGSLGISAQVLISKGNQELAVIDHRALLPALQNRRELLGYERQPYDDIKNKEGKMPAMSDLEAYGSEFGEYQMQMEGSGEGYGEMGGYGGMEDYGRGRRRGGDLRKRGGRSSSGRSSSGRSGSGRSSSGPPPRGS